MKSLITRCAATTCAAVLCCFFCTAASAGEEAVDETAEQAQSYFDEGAQLYFEREYSRALVAFHKAQQIHPHPVFLYNIAMSNWQLGEFVDASRAAAQALEMDDGQLPAQQQARSNSLVVAVDAIEDSQRVAQRVEKLDDEPGLEEAPTPTAATTDVESPPATEPDSSSGFGVRGWTGVGLLAAAAVAFGGAAVTNRQIGNRWQNLEAESDELGTAEFEDRRDEIADLQTRGKILVFSSAGLGVVGAALMTSGVLFSGSDDGQNMALIPAVDRPGLDVFVRW